VPEARTTTKMNVDRLARPFVTLPYLMHFRRSRLTLEEHGNIMLNKYREMNNASSITNNADINYSTKKSASNQPPKQFGLDTYIEHISQKIEKLCLQRLLLWQKRARVPAARMTENASLSVTSACEHG